MDQELQKKEKARWRVLAILGFFATFFSFLLICAAVAQATVMNPDYFYKKAQTSGYVAACHDRLTQVFASYGAASNFDAAVFEPVASEEKVLETVAQNIAYLYGTGSAVNYDDYGEQVNQLLLQNVEERGIEITDGIREGVQSLADSCEDEFRNVTTIPFLEFLIRGLRAARGPVLVVLVVLAVILAALLAFMWLLTRSLARLLPFLIDVCAALCILCAALPTLALSQRVLERVNITPETVRLLLVGYGNGVLQSFYPVLAVLAVITALLAVALWRLNKGQAQPQQHKQNWNFRKEG